MNMLQHTMHGITAICVRHVFAERWWELNARLSRRQMHRQKNPVRLCLYICLCAQRLVCNGTDPRIHMHPEQD